MACGSVHATGYARQNVKGPHWVSKSLAVSAQTLDYPACSCCNEWSLKAQGVQKHGPPAWTHRVCTAAHQRYRSACRLCHPLWSSRSSFSICGKPRPVHLQWLPHKSHCMPGHCGVISEHAPRGPDYGEHHELWDPDLLIPARTTLFHLQPAIPRRIPAEHNLQRRWQLPSAIYHH